MTVYREPVPGVHDLIPPEGRVTVELLDERGLKVLQRERSTNLIMNHWNECNKRMIRGDVYNAVANGNVPYGVTGFGFHGGQAITSETDVMFADHITNPDAWWKRGVLQANPLWGHPYFFHQTMRSLILSDSTEAVDADEFAFPGTCNAFCYLREAYTPAANLKRATLALAQSFRTATAYRLVAEWGTAYANGLHNSVGIGACMFPTTATGSAAVICPSIYPSAVQGTQWNDFSTPAFGASLNTAFSRQNATTFTCGFFGVNAGPAGVTDVPNYSGHRVSNSELWVLVSGTAGNQLTKMDLTAVTVRPFSVAASTVANGLSVGGPTMTTIGAGTNRCGVTVIGTDLWLAYGTTLKRCVKPTSTTLSVTNTYTPAGVGTLVDITTDGTNLYWLDATKVWVISASTGAVTTSWNHGITGTLYNICYMAAPVAKPRLYISWLSTTDVVNWNSTAVATPHSPIMTSAFTVGGTGEPNVGFCPESYPSGAQATKSGIVMPMSDDCKHFIGAGVFSTTGSVNQQSIFGPSHLSRTVLGAPVTKTSSNNLRCTYEYGF